MNMKQDRGKEIVEMIEYSPMRVGVKTGEFRG